MAARKSSRPAPVFWPKRIISGGQTGVDRAGLEAAIALGVEHGGWCPLGRLAEDGMIPSRYQLLENGSPEYQVRTAQNVEDSDATLILHERPLSGGTRLTQRVAARVGKPVGVFRVADENVEAIRRWLAETRPAVLNIAGPRESSAPGIERRATEMLMRVFAHGD